MNNSIIDFLYIKRRQKSNLLFHYFIIQHYEVHDDDFEYPLNPINIRYTLTVVREMQRAYQYRFELSEVLVFNCRSFNIPIPCHRAVGMTSGSPQWLHI